MTVIYFSPGSDLNVSTYTKVYPQFLSDPQISHKSKVLVAIFSAPQNIQARTEIRQTWAQNSLKSKHKTSVIFIIGQNNIDITPEIDTFQDILQINIVDSYMNLTLKSIFMVKYLSEIEGSYENLKFALKTDDDCYVNLQALSHLRGRQSKLANQIIGAILDEGGNRHSVIRDKRDKWAIPSWMYKGAHFPKSVSGKKLLQYILQQYQTGSDYFISSFHDLLELTYN